jgi:N-methylhydantoinase B
MADGFVIDPILREVIRNRLDVITAEMETALVRSAYSVILKEGQDCSAALFNARGEIVAQACALPQHMGAFIPALGRILEAFPPATMRDGDIYALNDPHDGGTHLPDLIVAVPAFSEGALAGFSVNLAHQEDIGGKVPGSMPADAVEIYQEGLIVPPLRLYEAGRPNETFFALLRRNVRIPEVVLGDIGAQVAAGRLGQRRLVGLCERYGAETLRAYCDALLDYAEALTRERLAEIPDGVYAFTDWMDNDGVVPDRRIPIRARVTVRGSDITVDFTGTSPQVLGPINAVWSATASSVYYVVRAITDPELPNNQGCYRPVRVMAPEGSLLNPRHPAPVAIRAHTCKRVADVVLGALVQAVPGRVPAAGCGSISVVSFGGCRGWGQAWGCTDIVAGGMGARPVKDGIEAVDTDVSNCTNIPAEALEMAFPLRAVRYALRPDGGGGGEWRGGTGVERVLEVTAGEVRCSYRSERHFVSPWGLFGGQPGARWETSIRRASGEVESIPSKAIFTLRRGDRLRVLAGGGGGYGEPTKRSADRVLEDVRDGKVSPAVAREVYGVVVDQGNGQVRLEETAMLRDALASRRGPVRWTYDRGEPYGKE